MYFNEKNSNINKNYDYTKSSNSLFGFLALTIVAGILFFIFKPDLNKEISLIREISLYYLNYYEEKVGVLGTGSMYPTFPKGEDQTIDKDSTLVVAEPPMLKYPSGIEIFGKKYLDYKIQKGDLVAFNRVLESEKDENSGYIKRVIATEGDEIEIKGGIVYLNGNPSLEPYTSKARSTFGGEFLSECTRIKIPQNKLFVMGDNRKESLDSRFELGLVDLSEVTNVMSSEKQQEYKLTQKYRDTSKDQEASSKITLNKAKYLDLLNEHRKLNKLAPLKYNALLEKSSRIQSQNSLKEVNQDLETTMGTVGYQNVVIGSYEIEGYFDEEELFNYQKAFPGEEMDLLTNTVLQDIGISEVEGIVNNCPKQVITIHLGGYVPATYDPETLRNLKLSLENLVASKESWSGFKEFYQDSSESRKNFDRIQDILSYKINNYRQIIKKVENREYLNKSEENFLDKEDQELTKELIRVMEKLNSL